MIVYQQLAYLANKTFSFNSGGSAAFPDPTIYGKDLTNGYFEIPEGCSSVKINLYGNGGAGGGGDRRGGGGGGGGGHCRKTLTITSSDWGKSLYYFTNSTGVYVQSNTYTLSSNLAALHGASGTNSVGTVVGTGGAGGTASGGDTNVTGVSGANGVFLSGGSGGGCDTGGSDPGGAGGLGGQYDGCIGPLVGESGFPPGGGGGGGAGSLSGGGVSGGSGSTGNAIFFISA